MDKLQLMRLSEDCDDDAFTPDDFPTERGDEKDDYDAFYDDVKQPSRYIREDW